MGRIHLYLYILEGARANTGLSLLCVDVGIGVRANIHLGGRPSFARMDSVGGGVVPEIFRDPILWGA